jgi:hypothetical protein
MKAVVRAGACGNGGRARGAVWHVTANEADPFAACERPDTHQDTPPDAFRV